MKLPKILLALSAAFLPFGASVKAEAEVISYDDALQCTALMAMFTVIFEEEKDEKLAAVFDDLLTRWSVVASARGEAAGKEADKDIDAVTEKFGGELEALGDDEAAVEKLFEERGDKCQDLQAANRAEFDAVDVDAINAEEGAPEDRAEQTS